MPEANRLFQFTRPRGARPIRVAISRAVSTSFNSRAHAGRDCGRGRQTSTVGVSIHAPTRGATSAVAGIRFGHQMFQFTRPRGARLRLTFIVTSNGCFNSRAHAGRDLWRRDDGQYRYVSIHAPTRGATTFRIATATSGSTFQFTRPRGARHKHIAEANSAWRVSIHAPTRGATPDGRRPGIDQLGVSIHAPTRGATCRLTGWWRWRSAFQFTRPRGARLASRPVLACNG